MRHILYLLALIMLVGVARVNSGHAALYMRRPRLLRPSRKLEYAAERVGQAGHYVSDLLPLTVKTAECR